MAALIKSVHISKAVNNITKLLTNLSVSPNISLNTAVTLSQRLVVPQCALLHTTSSRHDLMEFFEPKDNWGLQKIKVGRSWRKDELRIKSNEDLHKLWYVLLKERNMLLTMEEACKEAVEVFPNPERIDKVNESMSNLESVVRERNKAYYLLETGTIGERPGSLTVGALGMRYFYRMAQYAVPKYMNAKWHKKYLFGYGGHAVRKFLRFYREKLWNEKRKAKTRERNRVLSILRRFPDVDLEVLQEQYPSINVKYMMEKRKAAGHHVPRQ